MVTECVRGSVFINRQRCCSFRPCRVHVKESKFPGQTHWSSFRSLDTEHAPDRIPEHRFRFHTSFGADPCTAAFFFGDVLHDTCWFGADATNAIFGNAPCSAYCCCFGTDATNATVGNVPHNTSEFGFT